MAWRERGKTENSFPLFIHIHYICAQVFQFPRVFTTEARKEIYFSKLIVERKFIIRCCGVVSFSFVIREEKIEKSMRKFALKAL